MNWKIIHAYESGLDDGFFKDWRENWPLGGSDEERIAYERGYDHGVWLYRETSCGVVN